ncbi:MAG: hypothetical protein R3247_14695, partial [Rhodothermales bacterium]|nr:hypothetical protein [Rhodothermales bacterium]
LENGIGARDFLDSTIPYSSVVEQMGQRRAPLADYAPASEPARAFQKAATFMAIVDPVAEPVA